MTRLRTIVEDTLVPHSAFEDAIRRLEQCFTYAEGASEPICVALIGEARTGKSRALEEFFSQHPKARNSEGLETPILRVKTPAKPTVKSLATIMLHGMGDPMYEKGTEYNKTVRLQTLIRDSRTRMVMIDEFQHFVDKGSNKIMHNAADWLKVLVDDCHVALVVAGLPTCQAVLERDEQLSGRLLAPMFMPRFDWHNKSEREEFEAILGAFHESIGGHFDLPALDSPEMAFRCYCATGGLMGYLSKFLRQAVWNALDAKNKAISLSDLAKAHDMSVWNNAGLIGIPSPFTRDFAGVPTDDMIAKIKLMGLPKEQQSGRTRPQTGKKPASNTAYKVRDVLSAT